MRFASSDAASEVILTPLLCARLLIQLSRAAPLGRVHWMTLPWSCTALSRGLLAVSSSSTSTIRVVVSGSRGIYSANPFSKPPRDSAWLLPLFLPFFGFAGATTASFASTFSAGTGSDSSPLRFFGNPSSTTRRASVRKGKVSQVAVIVASGTSPPV